MSSSPKFVGRVNAVPAGFLRRLASLAYETLITIAIAVFAGFAFVAVRSLIFAEAPMRIAGLERILLQAAVLVVLGFYYVWCWRRGQTLPMKTWRLRLVEARVGEAGEAPVSRKRAIVRYALTAFSYGLALVGAAYLRERPAAPEGWLALLPLALTLAWPLWDRERQFLHDRLAGTFLVRSGP